MDFSAISQIGLWEKQHLPPAPPENVNLKKVSKRSYVKKHYIFTTEMC